MASLTLNIGQLSESVSMPDAAALELLTAYLLTLDVDEGASNAQKARAVLRSLAQHMREEAARGVHTDENRQLHSRAAQRVNALSAWDSA